MYVPKYEAVDGAKEEAPNFWVLALFPGDVDKNGEQCNSSCNMAHLNRKSER